MRFDREGAAAARWEAAEPVVEPDPRPVAPPPPPPPAPDVARCPREHCGGSLVTSRGLDGPERLCTLCGRGPAGPIPEELLREPESLKNRSRGPTHGGNRL